MLHWQTILPLIGPLFAVTWLEYCRYGVKPRMIKQSIIISLDTIYMDDTALNTIQPINMQDQIVKKVLIHIYKLIKC